MFAEVGNVTAEHRIIRTRRGEANLIGAG